MDRTTGRTADGTSARADERAAGPASGDGNGTGEVDATGAGLLRGVKIAMVVMGLLLLAGFAFIGYEIYRRTTDPDYRAQLQGEAGEARATRTVRASSDAPMLLPEGAIITGTVAVGSRLALTVELLDGTQILYFANPTGGDLVEFLRTRPNADARQAP